MPAEAAVSVTVKDALGHLHTLRGDSWSHFASEASAMLEHDAPTFLRHVQGAFTGAVEQAEKLGLAVVREVFPGATEQPVVTQPSVVPAVMPGVTVGTSTVGQPLPQPTAVPSPAPVESAGLPIPGELRVVEGEIKKWVPAGVSKPKDGFPNGKPYAAFWGKP